MHAAASNRRWATEAQTLQRFASYSSPPLESAGMFQTRGLTSQSSPKWYFVDLVDDFSTLLHASFIEACGDTTWKLRNFSRSFPTFEHTKPTQTSVIFRVHCHRKLFWAIMCFWCSFSDSGLKHKASALFLQIRHLENRWSHLLRTVWEATQMVMVEKTY
jgi:hypothetical protein